MTLWINNHRLSPDLALRLKQCSLEHERQRRLQSKRQMMTRLRDRRSAAGLTREDGKSLKRAPNNGRSKDHAAYMRQWRIEAKGVS